MKENCSVLKFGFVKRGLLPKKDVGGDGASFSECLPAFNFSRVSHS